MNGDAPQDSGFVISGQDAMLDILSRYLEIHSADIRTLRSYVGSYNGLYALYRGKSRPPQPICGTAIPTGTIFLLFSWMLPGIPAVIVHLACRVQGFMSQMGTPRD